MSSLCRVCVCLARYLTTKSTSIQILLHWCPIQGIGLSMPAIRKLNTLVCFCFRLLFILSLIIHSFTYYSFFKTDLCKGKECLKVLKKCFYKCSLGLRRLNLKRKRTMIVIAVTSVNQVAFMIAIVIVCERMGLRQRKMTTISVNKSPVVTYIT